MPKKLSTLSQKPKIIVILGPTSSGKSDLAVEVAKKFNGEVISADSRQVYKGMDIGTGKVPRDIISNSPACANTSAGRQILISKPRIAKQSSLRGRQIPKSKFQISKQPYFYKGVIHHLLDVASPKRIFTVAQYQKLAKKALRKILAKGKIPIICGGTGYYIDSLIYDYQLPKVPPQPKLRKQLEKKSHEELFRQLKKLDPRRAKTIDQHNRRRLIRALEITLITKFPVPPLKISNFGRFGPPHVDILKIGIKKSPEELKKIIKKRLLKRLKQGMIEEVKNLHEKQGVSWKRLDDLGLEYRYVSRYLRQKTQIDTDSPTKIFDKNLDGQTLTNIEKKRILKNLEQEMVDLLNREIWRYAKRQMTWFKRDRNTIWITSPASPARLARLDRARLALKRAGGPFSEEGGPQKAFSVVRDFLCRAAQP